MFWAERRASAKALRQNEQAHWRDCEKTGVTSLVRHREGLDRRVQGPRAGRSARGPWAGGLF